MLGRGNIRGWGRGVLGGGEVEVARYQYGSRKLSWEQVVRIRQMYREGYLRRFIAREFKVSESSLRALLAFSTYKDVR